MQVRGQAGEHQVDGVRRALGHAYGGGSQFFAMWVLGTRQALTRLGAPLHCGRSRPPPPGHGRFLCPHHLMTAKPPTGGALDEDCRRLRRVRAATPCAWASSPRCSRCVTTASSTSSTSIPAAELWEQGPQAANGCPTGAITSSRTSKPASGRRGRPAEGPLRPFPHRLLPRRQRPHGAVQLALRPPDRRHLRPAHRGHRRRAWPRGVGGGDRVGHALARAWTPTRAPYRQSERAAIYEAAIDPCGTAGSSTPVRCTREEVEVRNKAAGIPTPGYDGFCRDRGLPARRGPRPALPDARRGHHGGPRRDPR